LQFVKFSDAAEHPVHCYERLTELAQQAPMQWGYINGNCKHHRHG